MHSSMITKVLNITDIELIYIYHHSSHIVVEESKEDFIPVGVWLTYVE